jgi:hypothetical protein
MNKVIEFIDGIMWHCWSRTWSLMDVAVCAIIIPRLVSEYSAWLLLLVLPWVVYSNHQARKYS